MQRVLTSSALDKEGNYFERLEFESTSNSSTVPCVEYCM